MANCLVLCLLLVDAILISGEPIVKDNTMEGVNIEEEFLKDFLKDLADTYEAEMKKFSESVEDDALRQAEMKKFSESVEDDALRRANIEKELKYMKLYAAQKGQNLEASIKILKYLAGEGNDITSGIKYVRTDAVNYEVLLQVGFKNLRTAAAKKGVNIEARIKPINAVADTYKAEIKKGLQSLKVIPIQGNPAAERKEIKALRALAAERGVDVEDGIKTLKAAAAAKQGVDLLRGLKSLERSIIQLYPKP